MKRQNPLFVTGVALAAALIVLGLLAGIRAA